MSDKEERYKALRAREVKLKAVSGLGFAALGLGLQALLRPPSVIPFLNDTSVLYTVLGIAVVLTVYTTMKLLPLFREKVALASEQSGAEG